MKPLNLRKRVKDLSALLALSLFALCETSTICPAQAPANDDFANAIPLYGNSLTFPGTLANATEEAGESSHG